MSMTPSARVQDWGKREQSLLAKQMTLWPLALFASPTDRHNAKEITSPPTLLEGKCTWGQLLCGREEP